MVAEFMEFETPSEPQMGSANTIQSKYNNMILDLNDDLKDEIGARREQFNSISKTCDDLNERITAGDDDIKAEAKLAMKLAVVSIMFGVLSLCANVASMICRMY